MKTTIAMQLAGLVLAIKNCRKSGNGEWESRHRERIAAIEKHYLPSGSGFDRGSVLDIDGSTDDRLVIHTSFHHMNEHGFYDGWTEHRVTVRASLVFGIDVSVSGRNRGDIKEYLAETIGESLRREIDTSEIDALMDRSRSVSLLG